MKRKLLCLLLALLLCSTLSLPAWADAYIPPKYVPPYEITEAHRSNGDCKVMNVFLSNFVEAGLTQYSQGSPDSLRIAVVLKHLELNAKTYSKNVKKVTGDDGKTYMRISESTFEKQMKRLFDTDVSAASCPGYEDGKILVSAEHYNGPIRVFASVTDCTWESEDLYRVQFNVYQAEKDVSGFYRIANQKLSTDGLTLLGAGEALIGYDGGETEDSISSSDFTLVSFSMDVQDIPCAGENLPYGAEPAAPPTEAPTAAPTEIPTEAPTEDLTQETLTATAPAPTKPVPSVPNPAPAKASSGIGIGLLVLIIAVVVINAVAALILILVFVKKK